MMTILNQQQKNERGRTMGMYTEIIFKGKLKSKFRNALLTGQNEPKELWECSVNGKTYWTKSAGVWFKCNKIEPHKEFEDMGLAHRSDEQFFGTWSLTDENILSISAEIKNYHQETNKFKALFDIMFDEVYLYKTLYEEDDDWDVVVDNREKQSKKT